MFSAKNELFTRPSGGYTIARSARFRSSASANLSRTFATTGTSRQIFTLSFWVKRGVLGSVQQIMGCYDGSVSFANGLYFTASDTLNFDYGGAAQYQILTTQVFRDPSSWYHIVVACDSTQATAANRVKIYVNGSQVTSFSTANYPAQNANGQWMINTANNRIGAQWNGTQNYLDAYLTDVNFVDGQALTPSSFGETDAITGAWKPKKYSGTYGTNGFYLNFSSNSTAAALGTDFSGNSNTWTVNNISVTAGVTYDSMTDVPTLTSATAANYATLNPLAANPAVTAAQGNLSYTSSNDRIIKSTISVTSGKWYWEFAPGSGGNPSGCGAINPSVNIYAVVNLTLATAGVSYLGNGNKSVNGTATSYGATYTSGDVIGVALDLNANTITFYKNNASQGSISITSGLEWCPAFDQNVGTNYVNFGQRPFSYTAPSGFVALNTYNLSTPTIPNGATQMNATIYTGTGSNPRTFTGLGFQPDWIWNKSRSNNGFGALWDSVRGGTKAMQTYSTTDETTIGTAGGSITSFNSDGATFANGSVNDSWFNTSAVTYVSWQWKANGTAVTNTSGSITSTVSANTTAGFSIVTYTGTGANATVGHGLGVAPSMIIVKSRSQTANWLVWHTSLPTPSTAYLLLNLTDASTNSPTTVWNSTLPTSSVFSLGTNTSVNNSTSTYVAYCFAAVAGYSAFGSYTGNGSTDGTFVYTGFRPRFILIKSSTAVTNWNLIDTARDSYNTQGLYLFANSSAAEGSTSYVDILSNGFKLRNAGGGVNGSGSTYIYMAFAENPFKYSLAR